MHPCSATAVRTHKVATLAPRTPINFLFQMRFASLSEDVVKDLRICLAPPRFGSVRNIVVAVCMYEPKEATREKARSAASSTHRQYEFCHDQLLAVICVLFDAIPGALGTNNGREGAAVAMPLVDEEQVVR